MTGKQGLQVRASRWALVALFLLAFIPRAIYPVSRPLQWYFRSAQFFQAILQGDWAGTLFSEHPGVTVMWLSGAALWGWYGLQSLLGLHPPAPLETEGYAFAGRVAVGILPLALLVALGIVWGWYLLRRLFDRRVAWVAALLWALDPFYLANSKLLHLDALLSTLMILSALWILIYLREHRLRQLVTSAILAGLALLTKTSALFLVPFLALCLLTDLLRHPLSAIRNFLSWLLITAAICFALWPSLWVQPAASLDLVIRQGVLLHAGSPRDQPLLYRGALAVQNPGPRFYLDVLLFRTTFLTLPFALLGLVSAWTRRRVGAGLSRPYLLLAGFALFYFAQMSLGGWKDGRYMLPVLLALDVLAAAGLLWWAGRVHGITCLSTQEPVQRAATAEQSRCSFIIGHWSLVIGHWSSPLLAGLLLMVQAAIVLSHHPYYGTHYNALLGGPQAALRVFPPADFGEGLDLAGQYVDSQPGAENLSVGAQFLANEMLAQHVRAPVYDIAQIGEEADYLIFGVQYTMRGPIYPRWGALWEQTYKFRQPEFVASFAGIPYAWVHQPGAEPVIPHHLDVRLGCRGAATAPLRLAGYRLAQDEVAPGDTLLLTLYWQAEEPVGARLPRPWAAPPRSYTVFVHLQGPDGNLVAQQDNPPVRGTRPTSGWETGAVIEDPYELALPPDAPVGDYQLGAGMYDPTTLERLPAFAPDGGRLPEDRVALATVQVRPPIPWWRWALSAAWLAIIAAGAMWPRARRRE